MGLPLEAILMTQLTDLSKGNLQVTPRFSCEASMVIRRLPSIGQLQHGVESTVRSQQCSSCERQPLEDCGPIRRQNMVCTTLQSAVVVKRLHCDKQWTVEKIRQVREEG
jgi:hypothetical protein